MNRKLQVSILVVVLMATTFIFQNCGQKSVSFSKSTVAEKFGDVTCVSFSVENEEDCRDSRYGLIGKLYYLLDKTDGAVVADNLYDKNDLPIKFDGNNINSVNVIIDRGYVSDSLILMPEVAVPSVMFSTGFEVSDGNYLTDKNGKKVIEGFAVLLRGKLQLAPNLPAGEYEIGLLSDDGSLLSADLNGDGTLEQIIDSDGYHSTKLACSQKKVTLNSSSAIPIELRYYQGPRTTIALTIVMRKLSAGEAIGTDPECGGYAGNDWYGQPTNSDGYVPNYVNSRFGQLLSRGWFIPPKEMYGLPDSI